MTQKAQENTDYDDLSDVSFDDLTPDDLDAAELYAEDIMDEPVPSPDKKRQKSSGLFSTPVLIGLGVLVFLAIVYVKMSAPPMTAAPASRVNGEESAAITQIKDQTIAPPVASSALVSSSPAAPAPVLQANGPLTPMPDFAVVAPVSTPSAAPDPVAMTLPQQSLPEPSAASVGVTGQPSPLSDADVSSKGMTIQPSLATPVDVQSMKDEIMVLKADLAAQKATLETQVAVTQAAPLSEPVSAPAPLQVDMAPIQDISTRLVKLENQMSLSLSQTSRDVEDLRAALALAQQKINYMTDKIAALAVVPSVPSTPAPSETVLPVKDSASVISVAEAPVVTAAPASVAVVHKTKVKKPALSKPAYILRAANPSIAYLARKSGGALITVKIGDVVDGIGTVRSIDVQNGRWVVRGSMGSVFQ